MTIVFFATYKAHRDPYTRKVCDQFQTNENNCNMCFMEIRQNNFKPHAILLSSLLETETPLPSGKSFQEGYIYATVMWQLNFHKFNTRD
jgi:hypothetical protein